MVTGHVVQQGGVLLVGAWHMRYGGWGAAPRPSDFLGEGVQSDVSGQGTTCLWCGGYGAEGPWGTEGPSPTRRGLG